MEKHKEYLNKLLGEADEFTFKVKDSTPDSEVSPKYGDGYNPTSDAIDQVDDDMKKSREESYVIQTILDKVQDVFRYTATQTLYQNITEPVVPALNGGMNFMLDVNMQTLTIDIDDDGKTSESEVQTLINVFKGVLKKKFKSKFDVEITKQAPINMGRLDSNRFDIDIIIHISKIDPRDITDLGDDERLKTKGK